MSPLTMMMLEYHDLLFVVEYAQYPDVLPSCEFETLAWGSCAICEHVTNHGDRTIPFESLPRQRKTSRKESEKGHCHHRCSWHCESAVGSNSEYLVLADESSPLHPQDLMQPHRQIPHPRVDNSLVLQMTLSFRIVAWRGRVAS